MKEMKTLKSTIKKNTIKELKRREKIKEIFDKELKYNDGWKLVADIQSYNYANVIAMVNDDHSNAFFNEEIRNNTFKETFDLLNEMLVEDYGIK